ncbi:MAG: dihydroorotate dehydrogenase electron transfer subunit [Synergistaceae bacterium]|nr:dihydroorotate dehydrogenase electron transfer subunit [Synergistaceae bacterium]
MTEKNPGRCGLDFIHPLPGQFVHAAVPGSFLRRPVSVAGFSEDGGKLRLIVRRVGEGSRTLAALPVGSVVKMLCPLGRPFPMELAESAGSVWIVAGGIGLAPLLFAARYARERGVEIESFAGFRDEAQVFGVEELEECGGLKLSLGGLVTDALLEALERERPGMILACGPGAMLRALQRICAERGISAYVSLEEHMGCGVGACLVCSCGVNDESGFAYKRVCADGPTFNLSEVAFG